MRRVAVALLVMFGCKDETPPPPPPAPPPAPAAPAPVKKAVDPGSCTLHVTGAATIDETTPGGHSAASSKYWQSDEDRATAPMPALTVNCVGKDVRLSLVAKPDATVPFGPRTYTLAKKQGDLVPIGRAGKPLADFVGTVEITAFDRTHIAGIVELSAAQQSGRAVKLEGTFDLACVGFAGCSN